VKKILNVAKYSLVKALMASCISRPQKLFQNSILYEPSDQRFTPHFVTKKLRNFQCFCKDSFSLFILVLIFIKQSATLQNTYEQMTERISSKPTGLMIRIRSRG